MSTPADVVVVGGGPAGVAAALEMRRRGVQKVIILDREPGLGGATRHCSHSPFGMREFGRVYFGAAYGRRLEQEAAKAGIDVRTGHSVVELGDEGSIVVTSHQGVETLTARRIMIATGVRETPRSARLIAGDRPVGVLTTGALQAYVAFHGLVPFRRPVIVGSELVSLSAILTCVMHGARPVAMIEPQPYALARAPLSWFPTLMGITFHRGAEIVAILGRSRVEAVSVRRNGRVETLACDGVLLTGQFTPEASLFLQSLLGVDAGSAGPAVDQDGRSANPFYFAGGNVLRAVETGGWAFREGRAIGATLAQDLVREPASGDLLRVSFDDPIKLVVPNHLRRSALPSAAFTHFQLRFLRRARGRLHLEIDGRDAWQRRGQWLPERRILVAIPTNAPRARQIHFGFKEEI
jgi:NADPH-dependent 2,4-dienoyl-CoA reductase/sulfur reductase-like enzyme